MRATSCCVPLLLLTIGVADISAAKAWTSNFPSGPVRVDGVISPPFDPNLLTKMDAKLGKPANPGPAGAGACGQTQPPAPDAIAAFGLRTVAYPADTGAALGVGWNFLINQKMAAECITFAVKSDTKYQNADVNIQQVIDDETFDIAVNAEFSGKVNGVVDVLKLGGQAKTTLNASHHMSTQDTTFVAHGSVTSGVDYAAPDEKHPLALKPELAKLAQADPFEFRKRCGDGYVASIGGGTDLYVMFHTHNLQYKDHLDLQHSASASVGIGDALSVGSKSKFGTTIDNLYNKQQMDIEFIQRGGKIKFIPTTLDKAKEKMEKLAEEEREGERPIFITIRPYSELANWPPYFLNDTSDERQRAIRYSQRLVSILYELLNIQEDYQRDRTAPDEDAYLYDYQHQLRADDLNAQITAIRNLRGKVDELLTDLNRPECNSTPVSEKFVPVSKKAAAEMAEYKRRRADFGSNHFKCHNLLQGLIKDTDSFDDFKFWMQLPLPINVVSPDDLKTIKDFSIPFDKRKFVFEQNLYKQWVYRIDNVRCRLFFECLKRIKRRRNTNR